MRKIRLVPALLPLLLLPMLAMSVAAQKSRRPARGPARAAAKTVADTVADYFPLRVGNSWTYLHNEGSQFTIKVMEEQKQADGTMRYKVVSQAGLEVHYWYSKPDGWVLLHHKSYVGQEGVKVDYDPGRQYLMNPLVAGKKWFWKGKGEIGQDITESNEITGLETVKVPAGTFRAMKIVSQVADGEAVMTRTTWYAEGVGLVKSMSEGRGLKYGWELSDYSFKKGTPKK